CSGGIDPHRHSARQHPRRLDIDGDRVRPLRSWTDHPSSYQDPRYAADPRPRDAVCPCLRHCQSAGRCILLFDRPAFTEDRPLSDFILAESGHARSKGRRRPVWLSLGLLAPLSFVAVLGVAVWAPHWLSSFDPEAVDPNAILLPPDAQHWFGT